MAERQFPTPAEFAAPAYIHGRIRHTHDSWILMMQYLNLVVTTKRGYFHTNFIRPDPRHWEFDVSRASTETPEGEALHMLYQIHTVNSEHYALHLISRAQHRFNDICEDRKHHWSAMIAA